MFERVRCSPPRALTPAPPFPSRSVPPVYDAEGAKFGWLVLDLRSAKRNAAPGGAHTLPLRALRVSLSPHTVLTRRFSTSLAAVAQWLPVNVTWRGVKGSEPPALRVHHALFETRELEAQLLQQAEEEALTQRDLLAALTPGREPNVGQQAGSGNDGDVAVAASAAVAAARRLVMSGDGSGGGADVSAPGGGPAAQHSISGSVAAALGGEVRLFRLVASLPRMVASPALFGAFEPSRLFLRAAVPPALVAHMVAIAAAAAGSDSSAASEALTAAGSPLVTGPPMVEPAASGGGGATGQRISHFPGSSATWQFAAGVASLAHALAAGPRLVVELCAKGEDTDDVDVLAVGTAPLAPLLHTSRLELDLPMLEPLSGDAGAPPTGDDDEDEPPGRVVLATLHVTLALRELGMPSQSDSQVTQVLRTSAGPDGAAEQGVEAGRDTSALLTGKPAAGGSKPRPAPGLAVGDENTVPGVATRVAVDTAVRSAPEYEAAWELQVWKAQQQAAFRAALAQTAAARMDVLASSWRAKEEKRLGEAAERTAVMQQLEAKLRASLAAVQHREKELVAAGEAAALAREAERRELTTRLGEAEAAVRALQLECEHALSTERERTSEAARGRAAAVQRALAAEARLAAIQGEYDAFRAAVRASPEGQAQADAAAARRERDHAVEKAAAACAARDKAAAHVLRLADEMSQLIALRDAERKQAADAAHATLARQAVSTAADAAVSAAAGDGLAVDQLRSQLAQMAADVQARQHGVAPPEEVEDVAEEEEMHVGVEQHHGDGVEAAGSVSGGQGGGEWYAAGDVTPHQAVARHLAAHPGADPEAEAATLLRQRASLLGSGRYTRADAAIRRVEGCIEELWREAERRKGTYRGD